MKRAVVIVRDVMEHHKSWGGAFAEGLRRHGWSAEVSTAPKPCDLLVCWGVRHAKHLQRQAGADEVCVIERGYVGDRFQWASVSFGGGLNGRGIFRGPFADGSRWEKHFAGLMQPWRDTAGGYVLIAGQVPGDSALAGVDIDGFYRRARQACEASGRVVRFRPHPHVQPRDGAERMQAARLSLQEDLAGAAWAVTWNSNSGVDAVLAGVPTVAMDQGSMAWDVSGHELDVRPPTPDRTAWAHALAWKQYTRDEMASGACWAAVGAS